MRESMACRSGGGALLRRMRETDLEQVAELERLCFSESWSRRILEAGLHSAYDIFYVWEQEGEIFAYCNLRLLAGEGEIERIAVRPDRRRLGLGRKLMEAMEKAASDYRASAISLEVRESNLAARRLYESCGFAAEGMRKGYYHNPFEDAVIMWKRQDQTGITT